MAGRPSRLLCAAALVVIPAQAIAAGPPQDDFCDTGKPVARERLAYTLLAYAGVSPYPLAWAITNPIIKDDPKKPIPTADLPFRDLSPAWRVIADDKFCTDSPAVTGDVLPRCAKDDSAKLEVARQALFRMFRAGSNFSFERGTTGTDYMMKPATSLICPAETPKADPWITGPNLAGDLKLRIRGSSDGLQFNRTDDSEQFAGLDRATISWADDRTKDTSTFKLTLIAGLAIPVPGTADKAQIIPYVGYKIGRTKKLPDPKKTDDETLRVGAVYAFYTRNGDLTNRVAIRGEYAVNKVEGSEIFSENVSWTPKWKYLNGYYAVRDANDDSLFSIMPRLELRTTFGRFFDRGTRSDDESHNFWRAGFQYGATVKSDLAWLPVDVTVLNTRLWAFKGYPNRLSQLKGTISANLSKDKMFGVDLSYVRGRFEDLSKREDGWSIGFGAKF
jgi:hypothetical protein